MDGVGAAPASTPVSGPSIVVSSHSRFPRVAPTVSSISSFCHVAHSGCVIDKSSFSHFLQGDGISAPCKR